MCLTLGSLSLFGSMPIVHSTNPSNNADWPSSDCSNEGRQHLGGAGLISACHANHFGCAVLSTGLSSKASVCLDV